VRQVVVLFGGGDGGNAFADTWEWNGSDWLGRTTPVAPSARTGQAMAWDGNRQRVVLFGGADLLGHDDETWDWDGTGWQQSSPAARPPARSGHTLVFDPDRSRVVLFGGAGAAGILADLWEWDGARWTAIQLAPSPGGRSAHAMAWDSRHRRSLMLGGAGDSWLFGSLIAARAEDHGAACGPAGAVPVLSGDVPWLPNDRFALELQRGPAHAPCLFGLSAATASQPLGGGCTLYLGAPLGLHFAATDAFGAARLQLPLPLVPGLRGLDFHAQAAALDPLASGGLSLTQGRRLRLGD
jgi:hypothetical protein